LAQLAIVKVVAAFSVLVLAIALLGFRWTTCAVELAVIVCIVMIDRTATAVVDRWARGAAGEELVGEVLCGLRELAGFALHDVQLDRGNIDHVLCPFTVARESVRTGERALRTRRRAAPPSKFRTRR